MHVPLVALCRATLICAVAVLNAGVASAAGADPFPDVTVEAQRERDKLKHDVNEFVSTAIVQSHYDESLVRWTQHRAACPLVAGLNQEQGEFILERISAIATAAGAPLGSEKCKPDIFVIVVQRPALLLKKWAAKNPRVFASQTGAEVRRLVESSEPIRVWYNVGITSVDGASLVLAATGGTWAFSRGSDMASGGSINEVQENDQPSMLGSRLTRLVTTDFLSAVMIVDASRMTAIGLGQLADYVSLLGLAQINLNKNLGNAPTILSLFRDSDSTRPKELTMWDKALLHALYSTPQRDRMQISEMETVALNDIAAKSAHQ